MKPILGTAALLLLATPLLLLPAGKAGAPEARNSASKHAPQYTSEGELLRPADYREWTYLSSGLGMNYGPASGGMNNSPMFTNVFVNPESYSEFQKTGKWPDKTTFALEVFSSGTHSGPNKQGHFQDSLMALEAEVKDSSTPEGWSYYGFGSSGTKAKAFGKSDCFSCHEKNAAVEHSFVQFYPQLLDTALRAGTIKPGIEIPLNASRWQRTIAEKGWEAAKRDYFSAKAKGAGEALDEQGLNGIGYSLLSAQKFPEAVNVFELAAEENPSSLNALDSLADGYASSGRKADAEAATQKELAAIAADKSLTEDRRAAYTASVKQRLEKLKK
jgi:hypothetical protein